MKTPETKLPNPSSVGVAAVDSLTRALGGGSPKTIDTPVATVKTRHRESFRFPMPAIEINKFMATRAGKLMRRSAVEGAVEEYLEGQASKTLADAGGVTGLMKKVIGL